MSLIDVRDEINYIEPVQLSASKKKKKKNNQLGIEQGLLLEFNIRILTIEFCQRDQAHSIYQFGVVKQN